MIARKTYALLDADDEDEDDNRGVGSGIASVDSGTESERAESRSKRFRKKTSVGDEDDKVESSNLKTFLLFSFQLFADNAICKMAHLLT